MKRITIYSLIILVVCSCSRELIPVVNDQPGSVVYELSLNGEIDQVFATRANDSGFCNGDAVGLYMVNRDSGLAGSLESSGNQADNVRFTYEESGNKWNPVSPVYYKDIRTHVDIYGYYPYDPSIPDVKSYPFEVRQNQRAEGSAGQFGGYEASDFLWGVSEDITPSNNVVDIVFRHRMSSIRVALVKGDGWESDSEWQSASKDVLISSTARASEINLSNGSVKSVGVAPDTDIVPAQNGSDMWRAVVVPQEVAAGEVLVKVTIDGRTRSLIKDVPYTYYPGKMNVMTLSVNKDASSVGAGLAVLSEGVVAWENDGTSHDAVSREYVVIKCAEAGKLADAIAAEGYDLTKICNLKVEGHINASDFFTMRDEMSLLEALNIKDVMVDRQDVDEYFAYKANEIPERAFLGKSSLTRIVFPASITKIGMSAFSETSLSGALLLPDSLKEIAEYAFYRLSGLSTISFGNDLEIIGDSCFDGTSLHGEVIFPENLKEIGRSAFESTHLSHVVFPEGLKTIGPQAFRFCYDLTGGIYFPDSLEEISSLAFNNCGSIGFVKFGKNLKEIGADAFSYTSISGSLIFPDGILIIGDNAFYGSQVSSIYLPASVRGIGSNAFKYNNIAGILSIPEDLTVIPAGSFAGNTFIEGLVLGENVMAIDASAFENCYGISSIMCNAVTPPEIGVGAFNGVPKANFTVEVPEKSVVEYQTAPGWREFGRIAAHRDFAISRRLCRLLGKSEIKSLDLRAPSGALWSVESKPEWLSVSPMSGVGRARVRIETTDIPEGSGSRSGEIVFLLDGKDYRSATTVEQYETYAEGDVINVSKHSKGEGVDLVFLGDCYDAKDIYEGRYMADINQAIEHFFAIEPYKTYKEYFDVNIVVGCSEDSGAGDASMIRDARFGTQYTLSQGQEPDCELIFEYAVKARVRTPETTHVTIVQNSSYKEGVSFLYPSGRSFSICPVSNGTYPNDFRGVVQHESGGHGFGKLADESIRKNSFIQTCVNKCVVGYHTDDIYRNQSYGFYTNVSLTADMHQVPWSHMIFDPFYSNLVDVFEGACNHTRGVYRSERNSCMSNYTPYFNSISRESIVRRILRYAGEEFSYEEFKANDNEMNY